MTPKQQYYKNIADTMISNLKKRGLKLIMFLTDRPHSGYHTLSDQRKHCILRRFYNLRRNRLQYSRQRS